jgi:hypothetical protein
LPWDAAPAVVGSLHRMVIAVAAPPASLRLEEGVRRSPACAVPVIQP